MNRAIVLIGAIAVTAVVAWALLREVNSLPWEPTRELDASAVPVVERYLQLAYGRRDCAAADRLLDPPSAFLEKLQCRSIAEPALFVWTQPRLTAGCREDAGLPIPGVEGEGFEEFGTLDCVETSLTWIRCDRGRSEGRANMRIYLAQRDGVWKISHEGGGGTTISSGGVCSDAERARLRPLRR